MVDGVTYECVELDGDGGADLAATARIRNGWMKFRELLTFLTSRCPVPGIHQQDCREMPIPKLPRCLISFSFSYHFYQLADEDLLPILIDLQMYVTINPIQHPDISG